MATSDPAAMKTTAALQTTISLTDAYKYLVDAESDIARLSKAVIFDELANRIPALQTALDAWLQNIDPDETFETLDDVVLRIIQNMEHA
jgi:hypothetical protein